MSGLNLFSCQMHYRNWSNTSFNSSYTLLLLYLVLQFLTFFLKIFIISTSDYILHIFVVKRKLFLHYRGIIRRNSIWDKLIFGKVQELLGGRVKIVITGSAPLSQDVNNFIRCAFGCQVSYSCQKLNCNGWWFKFKTEF